MDVADATTGIPKVKDELSERCQKLFQDFLEEYVHVVALSLIILYIL